MRTHHNTHWFAEVPLLCPAHSFAPALLLPLSLFASFLGPRPLLCITVFLSTSVVCPDLCTIRWWTAERGKPGEWDSTKRLSIIPFALGSSIAVSSCIHTGGCCGVHVQRNTIVHTSEGNSQTCLKNMSLLFKAIVGCAPRKATSMCIVRLQLRCCFIPSMIPTSPHNVCVLSGGLVEQNTLKLFFVNIFCVN